MVWYDDGISYVGMMYCRMPFTPIDVTCTTLTMALMQSAATTSFKTSVITRISAERKI
jgi:hypothetical protein